MSVGGNGACAHPTRRLHARAGGYVEDRTLRQSSRLTLLSCGTGESTRLAVRMSRNCSRVCERMCVHVASLHTLVLAESAIT